MRGCRIRAFSPSASTASHTTVSRDKIQPQSSSCHLPKIASPDRSTVPLVGLAYRRMQTRSWRASGKCGSCSRAVALLEKSWRCSSREEPSLLAPFKVRLDRASCSLVCTTQQADHCTCRKMVSREASPQSLSLTTDRRHRKDGCVDYTAVTDRCGKAPCQSSSVRLQATNSL